MVNLVYVFIEGVAMKETMEEVVVGVFDNQKHEALPRDGPPRRYQSIINANPDRSEEEVSEEDERELNDKMLKHQPLKARPLNIPSIIFRILNLVARAEGRDEIDEEIGKIDSKEKDLVD